MLPGKAAVFIKVYAPARFLVDLGAASAAAAAEEASARVKPIRAHTTGRGRRGSRISGSGGDDGGRDGEGGGTGVSKPQGVGGDGGVGRLKDFLTTLQQVRGGGGK